MFLDRGYTGHEHHRFFELINMNARLYDPVTGRFLSPDPYVQDTENTQNYNRYSYALNNPLKYTDPSGEKYRYNPDSKDYEDEDGNVVSWLHVYQWLNNNVQFINPSRYDSGSTAGWDVGEYYNPGYIYFNGTTGQLRFLQGSALSGDITLRTINATGNLYTLGYSPDGMDIANFLVSNIGAVVGGIQFGIGSMSNKQLWSFSDKIHKALKNNGIKVQTRVIKKGINGVLSKAGSRISMVGGGLVISDIIIDREVRASHVMNGVMVGISSIPVAGWVIGGGFFLADMITLGISGQTISSHVDNVFNGPLIKF